MATPDSLALCPGGKGNGFDVTKQQTENIKLTEIEMSDHSTRANLVPPELLVLFCLKTLNLIADSLATTM